MKHKFFVVTLKICEMECLSLYYCVAYNYTNDTNKEKVEKQLQL